VLILPVKAPFNKPPHFPATADVLTTKIHYNSDCAYAVKEEGLQPRTSPLIRVKNHAGKRFHIVDRRCGWIIGTPDMQSAKRLVETLLALGVVPDFTRIDKEVNFHFFFNVSSKDTPAYYELGTGYGGTLFHSPWRGRQEIRVNVFCHQKPPNEKVMENITRLDENLYTLFKICEIPVASKFQEIIRDGH